MISKLNDTFKRQDQDARKFVRKGRENLPGEPVPAFPWPCVPVPAPVVPPLFGRVPSALPPFVPGAPALAVPRYRGAFGNNYRARRHRILGQIYSHPPSPTPQKNGKPRRRKKAKENLLGI